MNMTKLDNGMEYLFIENIGDISVIFVIFNVGSKDEVNGVPAGMSHFLEHVLFLGNRLYLTNNDIYNKVDDMGGVINGMTYQYFTAYYIKVSNAHIDDAIKLLASMVRMSCFKAHNIENERNVIIEEINATRINPLKSAKELFDINIFGNHPLSNTIGGDEHTLGRINKDNMIEFYNKFYCPENCAIVCVSKNRNILQLVSEYFGDWQGNKTVADKGLIMLKRPMEKCIIPSRFRIKTEYRDTAQDSLIFGFSLFGYNDNRRIAAQILNVIIAGMLTSRLFTRLRHTDRLVYSVNSIVQFFKNCGYIIIATSADNKNVEGVIKGVFEELANLRAYLVSPEELQKVKRNIKGVMDIKNENTLNLARFYSECLLNCSDDETMETVKSYLKKVDKVNGEVLRDIAREFIVKENCLLVCVGKTSEDDINKVKTK